MEIILNYKGLPCKKCGEIITVYSLSGLCRKCWCASHPCISQPVKQIIKNCIRCGKKIVSNTNLCDDCRVIFAIERHSNDLTHYHSLTVNGEHIAEHRYIWEKTHGKLSKDWIIHHLNGLKGDNRLENLIAMPRGDHDTETHRLEDALKARIRQLENQVKELETQLQGKLL